jgi:hypothetical protein
VGTGAQAFTGGAFGNAFGQAPGEHGIARILTLDTQEAAEERASQYTDAKGSFGSEKKQNTIGE